MEQNPEIDPCVYDQLVVNNGVKLTQLRKIVFQTKCTLKKIVSLWIENN